MNKKLVIVWVSVIVVLIVVGIYGLANSDRLVEDGAGGQIFLGKNEELRKCTYNTKQSNITYNFIVGSGSKVISRMVLTYQTNKADLNRFKFAGSIADASVTGISSDIHGQSDSFVLTMNVDMDSFTGEETVISTNVVSMDMLLEKVTDYDTYILDLSKNYSDDLKNLACS